MLHISQIHKLVEPAGTEFSVKFVAQKGYEVFAETGGCTSFHSKDRTMNSKFLPSQSAKSAN